MFIPVARLLRRVRQAPARAEELVALGRRLRRARAAPVREEERTLALELRALKLRVSAALEAVSACRSCARGGRTPSGAFAGGACCSGVTAELFSEDEVAALACAGTRPRHLHAPRGDHAGCAFRGATGCTLTPDHRPGRCVHYTCELLRRELRDRGELEPIDRLLEELKRLMDRFVTLRHARLDDELFAALEEALVCARPGVAAPRTDRA